MPDPRTTAGGDPAAWPAAGPIVLRRRRSSLAYPLFSDVLLIGAAGLAGAQGDRWTAPAAAVGALFTAWVTLAALRARTELRADGVWNRTILTAEVIGWADIGGAMATGAGAVVLTRRGGGTVKLAGPYGPRRAKQPSIEETLAVLRSRIEPHRPAGRDPESVPPTVVERRLSLRPALSLVIVLSVIGVLCGVLAVASAWLVAPAAFCLGLAAFTVVATVRARTLVGPDGVHNRALRRRVFVPWAEIADVTVSATPPRTVKVVRHDGSTTVLAAVRDADVPPDGLGPDDIADLIKERAGVAEVAPPPLVGARPLSLRPSRRPLLWTVPLAAGTVTAWTFGLGDVHVMALSGYLLAVPVYLVVLSVVLPRGRTDADAGGLRNRSLGVRGSSRGGTSRSSSSCPRSSAASSRWFPRPASGRRRPRPGRACSPGGPAWTGRWRACGPWPRNTGRAGAAEPVPGRGAYGLGRADRHRRGGRPGVLTPLAGSVVARPARGHPAPGGVFGAGSGDGGPAGQVGADSGAPARRILAEVFRPAR